MHRGNDQLILRWNSRVKLGDTVIHVGDFCCKGNERGVPGDKSKSQSWEALLNGKIIHIEGNHDDNNGTKPTLQTATINLGGRACFIRHRPISDDANYPNDVPARYKVLICGHVHEKWAVKWYKDILMVNVGVDVRHYAPITKSELIGIIEKEIKNHATGNISKEVRAGRDYTYGERSVSFGCGSDDACGANPS